MTTDPASAEDTQPPGAPGNLTGWDQFCGEVWLFWTQSFDDQTPQSAIVYEVYVNGVLKHVTTRIVAGYPTRSNIGITPP